MSGALLARLDALEAERTAVVQRAIDPTTRAARVVHLMQEYARLCRLPIDACIKLMLASPQARRALRVHELFTTAKSRADAADHGHLA